MELRGLERQLVFSRLRAWLGEHLEMPLCVRGLHLPAEGRYLEIGAGLGWGSVGLVRRLGLKGVVTTDYDGQVLWQARRWLAARGPLFLGAVESDPGAGGPDGGSLARYSRRVGGGHGAEAVGMNGRRFWLL
ncbi:MAG: hypothetical protein ACE5LU_13705 [Anaerolineae bacterium]